MMLTSDTPEQTTLSGELGYLVACELIEMSDVRALMGIQERTTARTVRVQKL